VTFLLTLGLRPRSFARFLTPPETVGGLFVRAAAGFGGGGNFLTPLGPVGGWGRLRSWYELDGLLVIAIGDGKGK
jgi:hypothetical protein